MTDWKSLAVALGLDISEPDRIGTLTPLGSLEAVFQRSAATLTSSQEMAVTFDPAPAWPAPEETSR